MLIDFAFVTLINKKKIISHGKFIEYTKCVRTKFLSSLTIYIYAPFNSYLINHSDYKILKLTNDKVFIE